MALLDNLVSVWSLEEAAGNTTIVDGFGSNNGLAVGTIATATGIIGQAKNFDRSDDDIQIPGTFGLSLQAPFTIQAYINIDSARFDNNGNTTWYGSPDIYACILHMGRNGTAANGIGLHCGPNNFAGGNAFVLHDPAVTLISTTRALNGIFDTWIYVMCVYDGPGGIQAKTTFYIGVVGTDANPVVSATATAGNDAIPTYGNDSNIGFNIDNNEFFGGRMDEVAIWNAAKTQADANESYNGGLGKRLIASVGGRRRRMAGVVSMDKYRRANKDSRVLTMDDRIITRAAA